MIFLLLSFDALAADVVFSWRQLRKHPIASWAAVLSLALGIGATTSAFHLVDAVLLRTLPVAQPERLFYVATNSLDREGRPVFMDELDYPTFRRYREQVENRADAMVIGMVARLDVIVGAAGEPEPVYRQFISGNAFSVFGLQPAAGRLLLPSDDIKPGGHPVAVISHDYWTRRFGGDTNVVGQTFRLGSDRFEIVGVAPNGFVGTEPGEVTDIFIPAMMNSRALNSVGWSWFRMWVRPKPGVSPEDVRQPLHVSFTRERQERLKGLPSDTPRHVIDTLLKGELVLLSASAGASQLQREYRRPLLILSFLVTLVLLVACTNVANLLTAQAAARAREMALRICNGASRWRLVQLVLLQSLMIAAAASMLGTIFASWAAPLVTTMLRVPDDPVRLVLHTRWREVGFSILLALTITLLFGLAPALRASGAQPIGTLRGSDDPRSRRRFMNGLLAGQVGFCVLVLFVSGLLLNTFRHLANRPLGFSADQVLIMETSATKNQPSETWMQVADHLRQTPGVESVSTAAWPLLSGNRWTAAVRLPGRPVEPRDPHFLEIAPRFFETMRIGQIEGRDFRAGDLPPRLADQAKPLPGVGIVNETFARAYFDGGNPVGKSVYVRQGKEISAPMEIIGYVRDAAYRNLREPIPPAVYVPMVKRVHNALLVRTNERPQALAPVLRREISRVRPDFQVRTVQTQNDFVLWHMIRERLLATMSAFFAIVALVLAAIGLYGVLNYSVTGQRREIGIRIALGARVAHVLTRVTGRVAAMVLVGAAVGVIGGMMSARFLEALLYEVKATDAGSIITPFVTLAGVALLAAIPPALRAARIDPAKTLRSE